MLNSFVKDASGRDLINDVKGGISKILVVMIKNETTGTDIDWMMKDFDILISDVYF